MCCLHSVLSCVHTSFKCECPDLEGANEFVARELNHRVENFDLHHTVKYFLWSLIEAEE